MVTKIAVHFDASFVVIICGSLLKKPKSKVRKTKIENINNAQTIINCLFLLQIYFFEFNMDSKKKTVFLNRQTLMINL
jgi:hypothetical protein